MAVRDREVTAGSSPPSAFGRLCRFCGTQCRNAADTVDVSTDDPVVRLTEAVTAMGSLADDLVRQHWPDLPGAVVAGLEEIARCRSAALRDLPVEVPVQGGEPDCDDGVAGTLLSAEVQRRPLEA